MKSNIIKCLGALLWIIILLPNAALATDNIVDQLPSNPLCADSGAILITYADVDNDPSTGAWVSGIWYPNETQIIVYPVQGQVNRFISPYLTWSHEGCSEPGEMTQKGIMVMRFIDATAPGWIWNDENTWQERKITEADITFAFEDGVTISNYLEYYGINDPSNVLNPNPEIFAIANRTWGTSDEVARVGGQNLRDLQLVYAGGFSEIVFVTDYRYSGIESLYLFGASSEPSDEGPDLYDAGESYRSFEPLSVAQGETITIHLAVGNKGDSDAPAAKIRFYASQDANITSDDYQIGHEGQLIPLAKNTIQRFHAPRTVDSNIPPGQYYVGWIIDPGNQISEKDETNNTAFKQSVQLTVIGVNEPSPEDILWVDDNAPSDPGPNNPVISDPNEDGNQEHPFDSIQEAIEQAKDGMTVRVLPGHYRQNLHLDGKSITVTSQFNAEAKDEGLGAIDRTILDGDGWGPVVTFDSGEDINCVLSGFTITGGRLLLGAGILIDNSGPLISHCVIIGNRATGLTGGGIYSYYGKALFYHCTITGNYAEQGGGGMSSYRGMDTFTNCIVWGNTPDAILADEAQITLSYCDIENGWPGMGNLNSDPEFAATGRWALPVDDLLILVPPDTAGAVWIGPDVHLQSQIGRYEVSSGLWIADGINSPCIDAGDPNDPYENEGDLNGGSVNIGAYGGTYEASRSQ